MHYGLRHVIRRAFKLKGLILSLYGVLYPELLKLRDTLYASLMEGCGLTFMCFKIAST